MSKLSRRNFIRASALVSAVGVSAIASETHAASPIGKRTPGTLIDTNVTLGKWPLRRLPSDETPALVDKLVENQVSTAWAGSFDGMLHRDVSSANERLADECRRHGRDILVPFGCANPSLPGWELDLKRCQTEFKMAGVRLYPNYNNYKLDAPVFAQFLDAANEAGLLVQIVCCMEDERMQHAPMQVPHVDASPLPALLKARPQLKVILLNWGRALKPALVAGLARTGQAWFEISTVESVNGVGNLVRQVPVKQVLFGSSAPLFYFESAALKLTESLLSENELAAIRHENASALTGKPPRVR